MPKQRARSGPQNRPQQSAPDMRARGLRFFQAGQFDQAIAAWSQVSGEPGVQQALAEAYLRRSFAAEDQQTRADYLRLAIASNASDPRFHYHLGLALHQQGHFVAAQEHYALVAQANPRWPGLALVQAVAALQQGDLAAAAAVQHLNERERQVLHGVLALWQNRQPEGSETNPLDNFWRGLSLIRGGDGVAAAAALAAANTVAEVAPIRRYYQGLAAAMQGDDAAALEHWAKIAPDRYRTEWSDANLAAVQFQYLQRLLAADDLVVAAELAKRGAIQPPLNAALNELQVYTLQRAAQQAAMNSEWARAIEWLSAARTIVSKGDGLGSPRALLHNLALAYEAQEQWGQAAETWRAMLRTRPRRGSKPQPGSLSDEQWRWVRQRVLTCYKKANAPGEAVEVYRQALKADPNDLEMRMELADALMANDQPGAATNELNRILERDATHVEARARLAASHLMDRYWYAADAELKQLIEQNPQEPGQRRMIAQLLGQLGTQYSQFGSVQDAYRVFSSAAQFAPDQYSYQISLAQMAFNMQRAAEAAEHIDKALRLGADKVDAYVAALRCWAIERQLDQARTVIARAEQASLESLSEFYVDGGVELIDGSAPPRPLPGFFAPPPPLKPRDDDWTRLASQLFDKAIAAQPTDAELRHNIAAELVQVDPYLGLRYGMAGVADFPQDVSLQITLGLLQAVTGDNKTAKATLRQAAKLARQQGNRELAQSADDLRQQVGSPMFGLALRMGPMMDELDMDPDEFFM